MDFVACRQLIFLAVLSLILAANKCVLTPNSVLTVSFPPLPLNVIRFICFPQFSISCFSYIRSAVPFLTAPHLILICLSFSFYLAVTFVTFLRLT